ncbi:IS110 family transposase [Mycobacterium ostraviense]|uniref:Transposase n=1 Tax=Mycobacterium ostraviense TaxID=2738409 RepID=A0A164CX11_9MYCO|nr:IS110 family transposase [Mycobacterium ostraviense]KZS65285.1 transposase [Mycobacterium ostraviense]UGT89922.1 IS110 family transposase [Mycobacterium ostraviense]UGT90372.1 IS110 family transposase [Mycobacterium ostraviense]UGT93428.1 IS110 family transposase [Mycobacterium ostraviense]
MDVVHARCAGIDISKRDAKVCVRIQGVAKRRTASTVTTWGAVTSQILALCEHLAEQKVTCVVMEATSDYWRPFYYLLEEHFQVMLVNARDVRNVPGRKSDVSDAAWLADLGAHGLVRASFVPPEPIRVLRDLTRARTVITQERTREIHRLEKLLEDAGIKLSSVATDITGVSGRLMLAALIEGREDPAAIADLAKRRLRSKIPALTEALNGHFSAHHAFMARLFLDRIDAHSADIDRLSARIDEAMEPFRAARELLCSIPGFSTTIAEVFVAETGAEMGVFPTAGHLASWAGTAPGKNESAGRVKSTKTRPGNRYLKGALGIAALAASRSKGTYFSAKYQRIAARRGPMKALVAVEHAMLVAAWNMLRNGAFYRDPGADYYTRRIPAKTKARAIGQLESLGYRVTLQPLADTA